MYSAIVNGVGGIDIYNKDIKLANLTKEINELREILNEICYSLDESKTSPKILNISEHLDILIVEYMKEINSEEEFLSINE